MAYQLTIGLDGTLVKVKKAPWLTFPLCIGYYYIKNFEEVEVEEKELEHSRLANLASTYMIQEASPRSTMS